MAKENFITGSVIIRNHEILVAGKSVFKTKDTSPQTFFQTAYEFLGINYPKFFKMDNLCKTGFLAAEILLRGKDLKKKYTAEEMGVAFSSANSSLDTDLRYWASTETIPSPSLFVYTLPNILVGELCIRFGIKGETNCFIFNIFDSACQSDYVNMLLDSNLTKMLLAGWADFCDEKFEAFFYLVEQTDEVTSAKHNAENINKIYSGVWKN